MSAQTFGATQTTAVAPRVNLLPPEIAEKNTLRRAQVAMVGAGLAAVAVVGVMYVQAGAKVSSARSARDAAVAKSADLNKQLRDLQHVRDTYAQVDAANKTLATAMHFDVHWSTYLQDLTLTIPENVWLEQMTVKMNGAATGTTTSGDQVLDQGLGTVTFRGKGLSHDDVASWLESLVKEKGYSNPYFTQSQLDDPNAASAGSVTTVSFNSTVNLTEKALSNTYAKGLER